MGVRVDITKTDQFYVGEDKLIRFFIVDSNDVPIDISLWTLEFVYQDRLQATLFTKTPTKSDPDSLGYFHVADVTIVAADTGDYFSGYYNYTLIRTDSYAVLAVGLVDLQGI